MMFGCCTNNEEFRKNFTVETKETEKGIEILISGKDPKKIEALKNLYKACREMNDGKCCCC